MWITETGFYRINNNIYYGEYPKEQISGYIKMSVVNPKNIKTDKPFSEDNKAKTLYDNHAFTEQEYINFEDALNIFRSILGKEKCEDIDFALAEQRLGIELPKEIKILYMTLVNFEFAFTGSERFLMLDEIYIDKGNLVFYKVKRTPTAISLNQGILMRYYKKNWEYDLGDESFLLYALDRLLVKIISQMPVYISAKISGELKRALNPAKMLKEIFSDNLTIMEEYNNYGNIIMYNKSGALAWFRQNGFHFDMTIACNSENLLNNIKSIESNFITWVACNNYPSE